MKHLFSLLLFTSLTSSLFAQSKEIILHINHKYDGLDFNLNDTYSIDSSTIIDFSRIEYYIHLNSISTITNETIEFTDKYLLVNVNQNEYNIGSYEINNPKNLSFHIGVNPEINFNDPSLWPQTHPLALKNPSMHWGWNFGYIYLALEAFIDKDSDGTFETPLAYHAVDTSYYTPLNLSDLFIVTETKIYLHINVDYKKMIEGINAGAGGIFHGENTENQNLINNIINNNVFSVPANLNIEKHSPVSTLFPNPFSQFIHIDLKEPSMVKVYNVLGELTNSDLFNKGSYIIDTSSHKLGLYIITIENKNGIEYFKLLKQ